MSPSGRLVELARRLRAEGVAVGSTVAGDLAEAADIVGLASAHDTYHAFRALCITSRDQIETFDRAFTAVFGHPVLAESPIPGAERTRTWSIEAGEPAGDEGDGGEAEAQRGASSVERLADKDFAELTEEEAERVRALIAAMVWAPADAPARRRRPAGAPGRPDPRRTLRRMVATEGDLLIPTYTERRRRRRPTLFIADVSGSMERYAEMLLYFAHAARGRLGRVEAFVFSTRLTRITRQLARRRPAEAIAEVAGVVGDWSGGTRIGAAIKEFNVRWSRRVSTGGPVVVIISDGWDRGDPSELAAEMARLQRSVHRVVWLNPLAGRAGFSPETRGMQASLPYIDDFLAAGTLTDLATVVALLESVPQRRPR